MNGIFGEEQPRQKEQQTQTQEGKRRLAHLRDSMFSMPQLPAVQRGRGESGKRGKKELGVKFSRTLHI